MRADPRSVVASLRDGVTIYAAGAGSFPLRFVEELIEAKDARRFTFGHPMRRYAIDSDSDYASIDRPSNIFHISDFTWDDSIRAAVRRCSAAYRPNHPHEAALTWDGAYGVDVLVTSVSSPDKHGCVSLGVFGGWTKDYIERTRPKRIIFEVNPSQSRILSDVTAPLDMADTWYESEYDLPQAQLSAVPDEQQINIAEYVAELIPDGATLQLGVGAIPDIIAKKLVESQKRHLGIHTENLSDTLVQLIESGVVDNSQKRIYRGKTVCTLALGTDVVYKYLDDNPDVVMLSVAIGNDPATIAQNHNQISINATIMVDLFGQCASEGIGPQHYSGTGGQWEFIYGANHSPGGRGIVTVLSTARNGEISTIQAMLPTGSVVSIPRNDAPTIVTEYGVAELRGLSVPDRARALIRVAHPRFREELQRSAREMGVLP